jgi:parallel beta-helix repeat protein
MLVLLLVGGWTLALKIQPLRAGTITVPDNCPTIQEAINNASEGDTVFVRNGVYQQRVIVNKTLSLIGENTETTVLDWGVVIEADGVSVSGFTMHTNGPSSEDQIGDHYGVWVKSSSCLITNNTMSECSFEGIFLDGRGRNVVGNVVAKNTFLSNYDCGILLWHCNDSLIELNVEKENKFGTFVYSYSCGNSIENNEVSNNTRIGVAIDWYCSANFLINNTIIDNGWGSPSDVHCGICIIDGCDFNQIICNNVTDNAMGLWQRYDSNNNSIYHNSFVNNRVQVGEDPDFPCENVWDNGYASGGNYWSDYAGKDLLSGPYQNVAGSDGIGDTSYIVVANNTDRYPLMNPFDPPLGDVDGNRRVDMQDMTIILDAFGSNPIHPTWNPLADINGDGKVDMEDIIIALGNFEKHHL